MVVKRTKSGKFTIGVGYTERMNIFEALISFFETHGNASKLQTEKEVMIHLQFSVLHGMLCRLDFNTHNTCAKKWNVSRAEAVALMWLLRNYDHDSALLQIKSEIHKQLS
ncbi:hypothetical protein [Chryseosolibacter indicus]|uniref:Uncharacterized protein n=1 Tax=Chryseosolibacter indicus TaxID=2782351 RepID=A0ABS5VPH8_9BACT|nr:hypothetical protein [Chryseosolibacter indicus]MBT1702923.1 hypothetical protein [Chryseosolibacter indicus]